MKKLLLLLLLLPTVCFAEDLYMVEKPDGSVAIVNYIVGSQDTIYDVMKELGFLNYPIEKIKREDIPTDRTDRNYWKKGVLKKIEVDQVKKTQKEAEKQAKKSEACGIFKLTTTDCDKAVEKGIIKI